MSIPSWAYVGAKIVCVNARGTHPSLKRGAVYTVDYIPDVIDFRREHGVGLVEVECLDKKSLGCFRLLRFRPLATKKMDTKMFRKLIEDIPSSITERLDKIGEMMND